METVKMQPRVKGKQGVNSTGVLFTPTRPSKARSERSGAALRASRDYVCDRRGMKVPDG